MNDYIKISESEFQYLQTILKRTSIQVDNIKEKTFLGRKEYYIPIEALNNKKINVYDDVELIYISEIIKKTNLSEIRFSNKISYDNKLYELIKNNKKTKYIFTNTYPTTNFINFIENYDLDNYNVQNVNNKFKYSSKNGYWSLSNFIFKSGMKVIPTKIKYLKLEKVDLGKSVLSKRNLNLPNLKSIECINCPSVMDIQFDYEIKDLTYYGSQVINQSFIYNIFNSLCDEDYECELKLDPLIYFDLMKIINNVKDEERKKTFYQNLKNIKWCESVGARKTQFIEHNTYTVASMYNWIKVFAEKYINKEDNDFQKIAILYKYIANNIMYDKDAVEKKHSSLSHLENGMVSGKLGGTNSFINGLVFNEFVCQGYTNFIKLALRYFNIPCYDIHCAAELENDKSNSALNHSMQEYIIDGKTYFSDLTWSSGKEPDEMLYKYFLSSVEELEKTRSFMNQKVFNLPNASLSYKDKVDLFKIADDRLNNPKRVLNQVSIYRNELINYIINNNPNEFEFMEKIEELKMSGEIDLKTSQELESYFQIIYIILKNVKELSNQYNVLEKDQLIDILLDRIKFNITLDNRLINYIYKIYINQMSENLNNLLQQHHKGEKNIK